MRIRLVGAALLILLSIGSRTAQLPHSDIITPTEIRIGANLPDLAQFGPVFINALKQAAPWRSREPVIEDSYGNIVELRDRQFAETVIYNSALYPAGVYALLYDGTGRFDLSPLSGSVVSRTRGRILLRVLPRRGYGIHLRLSAVDSKDYPRNIRLMLPRYEHAPADQIFYPPFVRMLRQYRILRFANWAHGNSYAESTVWPRRTKTGDFTQACSRGVSVEYMIALANATGDTPWFTIPVGATDYWVENFSALVAMGLDLRLRPIIEYGDGVWRKGSPANRYAIMAATNTGLHGDPLAWYSQRSVRIFALVLRELDTRPFVRVLQGPMPSQDAKSAATDKEILAYAQASRFADAFAAPAEYDQSVRTVYKFARDAGLELFRYYPEFHTEGSAIHRGGARFNSRRLRPRRPS